MKVTMDIEIEDFNVPNFVRPIQHLSEEKSDSCSSPPSIHLRDLSPEILDELCRNFRECIFIKAGKTDPRGKQ